MENSWKEAIEKVLVEENGPLHYTEITERILTRGYYETEGATPTATVNAQLASSIKNDGEETPFMRAGRGIFTLKNLPANPIPATPATSDQETSETLSESAVESSDLIIRSLGMYWQRDLVIWNSEPKMYGKQLAHSKPIDFGKQKGIYILYDQHTVVYVGRTIDQPIGKRLSQHTTGRFGSRWNRFSWFGLLGVTDAGNLKETVLNVSLASLIATLEALLIEALEPPQNRQRGDNFSEIEFIQDIDPELKEKEVQNTLRVIEQQLRNGS